MHVGWKILAALGATAAVGGGVAYVVTRPRARAGSATSVALGTSKPTPGKLKSLQDKAQSMRDQAMTKVQAAYGGALKALPGAIPAAAGGAGVGATLGGTVGTGVGAGLGALGLGFGAAVGAPVGGAIGTAVGAVGGAALAGGSVLGVGALQGLLGSK